MRNTSRLKKVFTVKTFIYIGLWLDTRTVVVGNSRYRKSKEEMENEESSNREISQSPCVESTRDNQKHMAMVSTNVFPKELSFH